MKKSFSKWNDGVLADIVSDTLTDGSKVYAVKVFLPDGVVKLDCYDANKAGALLAAIKDCVCDGSIRETK